MKNEFKEKETKFLSATTTIRYREPTSKTSKFVMQYVADYSKQGSYIPDRNGKVLMEATSGRNRKTMTLNKSGRSAVMGPTANAFVGASPDDPANY